MLECETYRHRGHHVGDPGDRYRSEAERKEWEARDPIVTLGRRMVKERQATEGELAAVDEEVRAEVKAAVEAAKAAPWPDVKEAGDHVFA
jgi:TPP-dependent pyruvate/acetoin dehydrogenase alpha subunit